MTPRDDAALLALAERDEARHLAAALSEVPALALPVIRTGRWRVKRARDLVAGRPHTRPELAAALGVPRTRAIEIARDAGLRWCDAAGVWRVRR